MRHILHTFYVDNRALEGNYKVGGLVTKVQ